MENFFGSKLNRFLTTIILGLVVVALGAYAYYTMQQARYFYTGPTTISVSGEGEVMAVPDIGQFSFSVMAEGDDAVTAQDASATKINEINAALEAAGVDRKDIKTEYYSLYPKYNYETMPCIAGMYCPGEQVQDGFEVNQTILVKVRNLETAGALLGLVGDKGATNISGLSFTIDDDAALKDEAREMAIADAKAKAEVLANNLGVRLTKMVGYYEDEGYPVPYYGMGGDMMVKQEMSSVTPDLPTGENITTSRVTLTFQVK
ncbi:hypothetical protein A3I99_02535 [Candidatus Kaiserbacteria bacterium RIFCSPLOWO2_02_FULL_45_11b]|uniref:SIMPL domain-containing protein n=1 Tax=Candidatus Kaiserbacteria bacterium RIFCSPLOWO2_12_FULL_45_26 TaxID=1798525 RepID=A0A1F6FFA1_9BACT|nr:MAG: hypothetical protein A2Z56_01725 [Candidatus Kaiserbacteria bacterium RIFCSPHIGHO2_12_45_16]OGG70264.1 MAG: hypothetical protein A2929_04280 [Candidatus Kaiserbacteria bacterium RIFCSPLOWO2_01_FULL_45_25]OGG81932.1 MAG: hypothetical protein A3I99_02535 [Candidatus Kaiserbacteria bacterium RIFCSPLOWO2_02_FULL_45_11b]OGG84528.1 MAG: hypothetical protein A3G90_00325 [Candidatus Kaiserbacteria bacterium RIFCSPLOWO2_12_FULL_45_26]